MTPAGGLADDACAGCGQESGLIRMNGQVKIFTCLHKNRFSVCIITSEQWFENAKLILSFCSRHITLVVDRGGGLIKTIFSDWDLTIYY